MKQLFMILPSEYVYSADEIDIPICLDNEAVLWIGFTHSDLSNRLRVHTIPLATVNDKTALQLCFSDKAYHLLITKLNERFGIIDHFADENIAQTEQAFCWDSDIKICRTIEHVKERDSDFTGTVSSEDVDGNTIVKDILIGARVA